MGRAAAFALLCVGSAAAQGDCGSGGIGGIMSRLQAVETACCEGEKCSNAANGGMPEQCTLHCAGEVRSLLRAFLVSLG